ncbi:DUF1444 family protein [Reyranella sp.]|uniref:DUF1444 family protein n=1 Tax=Reyranella sp. TaxID=1929291 RepID=UPI003D0ABCE6
MGASAGLSSVGAALGQSDGLGSFRAEVLDILHRKYPAMKAVAAQEVGVIEIDAGSIGLQNLYAMAGPLPARKRQAAIVEFLEKMVAMAPSRPAHPPSWPEVKELVYPRFVQADLVRLTPDLLHRPFSPGVVVGYVVDNGPSVSFINREEAKGWGMAEQSVDETAIANLEALSAPLPIEVHEPKHGTGLFAYFQTMDSYDAARLLLPQFRGRLLAALGGVALVGIPNRDFLVAWSPDFGLFEKIAARVGQDFREQPYAITDTIFRADRQGVRPATAAELRRR